MHGKILLIDSDDNHSKAIGVYLERHQYKVSIADSCDDALPVFDNLIPEIIIADPDWPQTDTIYLLEKVKKKHPEIQIIITSDAEHIDQVMETLGGTVASFLTKPLKSQILDHSLKQAEEVIALNKKVITYERELSELRDAQSLNQQLFDVIPCYISVQDRNFRLTATNRLFKKDFGDELGSFCYKVYKHRTSRCRECPVWATFEDGRPHSTEEIVTSKSGEQHNVMTWTAPVRNSSGRINQVMEMSTDITQIRRLQDHLTSLGLMLGSMSHGVKGMLTALDGGLYQLETGVEKKEMARIEKAFDQVKEMTGSIRKMVLEILYYAKSRELRYEEVDIAEMSRKLAEMTRAIADKNGISLDVEIAPSLGVFEIDPNWLQAAIMNFLENAMDACIYDRSKKKHCVKFKVFESVPDHISFIITDNGMGMDQETREKMFTLFFTSKGSRGTGLGLFIAHHVILQHRGNIKVESRTREGSRFEIYLPRYRSEQSRIIDFPQKA